MDLSVAGNQAIPSPQLQLSNICKLSYSKNIVLSRRSFLGLELVNGESVWYAVGSGATLKYLQCCGVLAIAGTGSLRVVRDLRDFLTYSGPCGKSLCYIQVASDNLGFTNDIRKSPA